MPYVQGTKYPYTTAGKAAAKKAGAGILAAGALERKKKAAVKASKAARKAAKGSTIKTVKEIKAMKKTAQKKLQARRRMKAGSGYQK